jgi:hypothetical protein
LQVVPLPFHDSQPARPPVQALIDQACSTSSSASSSGGQLEVVAVRQLPFRAYAVKFPADRWDCSRWHHLVAHRLGIAAPWLQL